MALSGTPQSSDVIQALPRARASYIGASYTGLLRARVAVMDGAGTVFSSVSVRVRVRVRVMATQALPQSAVWC